jgi:hypothetical protein
LKVKFFTKYDGKIRHAVVELSPKLRNSILNNGKVFVDYKRHNVVNSLEIIRCYRCLGFGHFSSSEKCPLNGNNTNCSNCSHNHHSNDCPPNTLSVCVNCKNFNSKCKEGERKLNTNHDAFSSTCPCFLRIKKIIESKIRND